MREKASETEQVVKEKASSWGEKIKATSQGLIETTKQVFAKIAEKIPGTDAHSRAKKIAPESGSQQSSQRP